MLGTHNVIDYKASEKGRLKALYAFRKLSQ